MKKTKKRNNFFSKSHRGGLAVSQIILLIASTIAISYVLGGQFQVVSAQEEQCYIVGGGKYKLSEIGDPNEWCPAHGGSSVCNGGSNAWSLKTYLIAPCEFSTVESPVSNILTPTALSSYSTLYSTFKGDTKDTSGTADEEKKDPGKYGVSGIIKDAATVLAIYGVTRLVVGTFAPEAAGAAANAVSLGFIAAKLLTEKGIFGVSLASLGPLAATGIGAAVAFFIFAFTFKKTKFEVASYSCFPWDAPTGGKDCEKCNGEDFPCTEYRCKSLGQACELLNKGTSEELCFWVNRGDVKPPVIQPWEETLTIDYKYVPDSAISPPDRGVRIVKENANGCVEPFTPLRFGVTLDEPAKCKIDPLRKSNFDEMNFFFGGSSTSKLNHTQTMSLPSPEALAAENITLENGGEFELYARCMDANGNSNTANFVFRFCVDEGPDTTPPLIVTTSIFNGMPISFNQTSVDLQVYVNEPSECRWSKIDQSYENMDTQMSCSTNVLEMNAQMLYQCSTTLTGLKDRTDNDFYFRCKDQPHLAGTDGENDRNTNTESFKFTLVGTRPLVIDSTEPNETIKDSTDIIKVTLEAKTSAGFSEGEAICSFSDTGEEDSFIEFFETGTSQHSQDLFLSEGSYTYNIRCVDLGGNADNKIISFSVESDSDAPVVVRIFHEENKLKIITDEEASCVYDNVDCSYLFEDGIKMSTLDDEVHSIDWDPEKNFYIKCEDKFGSRPFPNQCSIIARPFQI